MDRLGRQGAGVLISGAARYDRHRSTTADPAPLSIIVPVLNEADGIEATLLPLQALRARGAQLIVVDGGSADRTVALAAPLADRVLTAARGRARQMNAGAAAAAGQALVFLHADTRLPDAADSLIGHALRPENGRHWGRFDVSIEGRSAWLPLVAAMMNRRSRLTGIATGDQAMFVSREAFAAVGGFPDIPLMEDLALSGLLKKRSAPACLAQRVVTSGRRWDRHGVWRTIGLMWGLRLRYFLGADPRRLAIEYGHAPASLDATRRVEIAIMAKAPVAGQAKTRLIPLLGATGAARLQGWLLERAVTTAAAAGLGPVVLWCAGQPDHPDFRRCHGSGKVSLQVQPEGDLGVRMFTTAAKSPAGVLIIGTDCPVLTPALLREAAAALNEHDAVVFPAEDGGYVLIGMRRPAPELFAGVEWSTGRVMAQTRERLIRLGWTWVEPVTLWDVDRPADYERLAMFAWPDGRQPF